MGDKNSFSIKGVLESQAVGVGMGVGKLARERSSKLSSESICLCHQYAFYIIEVNILIYLKFIQL